MDSLYILIQQSQLTNTAYLPFFSRPMVRTSVCHQSCQEKTWQVPAHQSINRVPLTPRPQLVLYAQPYCFIKEHDTLEMSNGPSVIPFLISPWNSMKVLDFSLHFSSRFNIKPGLWLKKVVSSDLYYMFWTSTSLSIMYKIAGQFECSKV